MRFDLNRKPLLQNVFKSVVEFHSVKGWELGKNGKSPEPWNNFKHWLHVGIQTLVEMREPLALAKPWRIYR